MFEEEEILKKLLVYNKDEQKIIFGQHHLLAELDKDNDLVVSNREFGTQSLEQFILKYRDLEIKKYITA